MPSSPSKLRKTVPQEHAGRGYHPDPGSEVRRCLLFFFNDTATTEIYTLSLHDALPISLVDAAGIRGPVRHGTAFVACRDDDRARPLCEREPVAPGAVIEPTEVAPDDHGVGAARWRGRGDVRRPGPCRAVPEEHAGRG